MFDSLIGLLLDDLNEVLHHTAPPLVDEDRKGKVSQQVLRIDLHQVARRVRKTRGNMDIIDE